MNSRQLRDNTLNKGFVDDNHVTSIFNISSKRDQAIFRTAFLRSTVLLFVLVCGACAVLVYHILEPFLQSILWSILAGAFLFPFKTRFTSIALCHLRQWDSKHYLLFYGLVILLPVRLLDRTIESLGPLCIQKWKQLVFIVIFLPSIEFLQSGVVYRCIITIGYDYCVLFERYIHYFDSLWVIWIILIYLFAVLIIYNLSSRIKSLLNLFSIPIWLILFIYLSQFFFSINYRWIIVTLVVILLLIGYIVDQSISALDRTDGTSPRDSTPMRIIKRFQTYFHTETILSAQSSSSSTPYFTFLLWSFIAIKLYQFYWYLIPLSIFIIIYRTIKCCLLYTYAYLSRQTRVKCIVQRIITFLNVRRDVLSSVPLHNLSRFLVKGDKKINHSLQKSIDYLISACIIMILFIIVLFGAILLTIQIHHESIHMIKLTSSFFNQTTVLQHIVPDKDYWRHFIETAVNNFYMMGRRWITTQVVKVQPPRIEPQCCLPLSVVSNESPYMHINTLGQGRLSNKNLEEQVLQLWDHLYIYITNTSTIFNSHDNMFNSLSNQTLFHPNLLTYIQTNFEFHRNDLYRLIRNNLDLLRTIFDSIWSNAILILTLLSSLISLLFTGGFVLFNFLVSFLVFITLLFYLLSHSDQLIYRPIEWLNNMLTIGGSELGQAVNDVVTSVFIASFKMATFYGLYTYVLHTFLGANLVFLPAVIASICAVMLKSYWAALPGCLDLWLVQQRPLSALILLLAQIIPVYIVDATIYSEVKGGGHQYLTALAIAGGVYYRGIEGAFIGPIILCCLLVGIRMFNETISTTLFSKSSSQLSFSVTNRNMTRKDTD